MAKILLSNRTKENCTGESGINYTGKNSKRFFIEIVRIVKGKRGF